MECFRVAASGVKDETQIHTHMCYAEFNDIIDSIGAPDADVISIETSRSEMELLGAFMTYRYPNEIGPGVYDIYSPRVPSVEEMTDLLDKATRDLSADHIWVNPDCGFKTRGWDEVRPALANIVKAARAVRGKLAKVAERSKAIHSPGWSVLSTWCSPAIRTTMARCSAGSPLPIWTIGDAHRQVAFGQSMKGSRWRQVQAVRTAIGYELNRYGLGRV